MRSMKLGDLVAIRGGGTPDRSRDDYWGGEIPWVTVKDFKSAELSSSVESITSLGLKESASNLIPAGSIIVPTRMALGKVAVNTVDVAINQDLKALSIQDPLTLDRDYLFRFLLSKSDYLSSQGQGATVKGITLDVLRDLDVPLPSIDEQQRIAAILDKADSLRRKRQEAIQLADDFLRAVFLDMFGDPGVNPKGFPQGTVRDLLDSANYGTSDKANELAGEYPVLRMNNITYDGSWDFSSLKYMDLDEKGRDKYLARRGDILFNRTNSVELVGKTAVFEEDRPMAFAGYLVRARVKSGCDPYYVAGYLNSLHGKATLRSIAKSIVGMANINAQEMQNIPILLPPNDLQRRYGQIVTAVRANQKTHRHFLEDVLVLTSTLSSRLFN